MKVSRLMCVLCRLVIVFFILSNIAPLIAVIFGLFGGGEVTPHLIPVISEVVALIVAILAWCYVPRIAFFLDSERTNEPTHTIDGAHIATIVLALIGLSHMVSTIGGVIVLFRSSVPVEIVIRTGVDFLSGLGLFIYAPSMGIWLARASKKGEVNES
jgi:hypothetical protein